MCVPFSRKKNCYPKNFNTKTKHNRDIDIIVKRYLKKFLHVCLDILFIFSSKFVHYYPSGIFNQSVSGIWYYVWGHSPHNLIETYHYSILMTILYCLQGPLCNKIANFVWFYCFSTSIYRMIFHKFYVENCWNAKPVPDSQTNFKILRQSAEETWP